MRDVIVIGAGPAGSCVAAGLAQRGWDVLLLEKDRFPRHKVCGEFLSPESQQSLAGCGLFEDVRTLSPHPITRALLVSQGGAEIRVDLPGTAWGVSRRSMDQALAQGAERHGATFREGQRVMGSIRKDQHYSVELSDGVVEEARMVLFACGRHSSSSLPPHTALPARSKLHVGAKVHYRNLKPSQSVELFFFDGGYCGINSIEGGNANVCLLSTYRAFADSGRSVTEILKSAANANSALARRLADGSPVQESACAVAPVDVFRAPTVWADGAPAVGDTAAMIPPLCGDGMAMALRSAELCTPLVHEFLKNCFDQPELHRRYASAWNREFSSRLRMGRWLQRLLDQGAMTEMIMGIGGRLPFLSAYLVQATRGTPPERSRQ